MLRRILRSVTPYWARAIVVGACLLCGALLGLATPWFVKTVVDVALPHRDLRLLWWCCAAMIAVPVLAELIHVGQDYVAETVGQDVMLDLRTALYRRFHDMPFQSFAKLQSGEAVSSVLNDVQGVGGVISGTLVDIVENTVVVVSASAFMLVLDWRIAVLALSALPLLIARTRRVGTARKALKRSTQACTSRMTGVVTETLSISGALFVRSFDGAEIEVRRFHRHADELKRLALSQMLVGRWFRMLMRAFESIGPAIVFALGGWLIVKGRIPLGTVVALATLMKRVYKPASDLAGVHVDLMTSYAYFERVFAVFDRTAAVSPPCVTRAIGSRTVRGRLEFRDVSFIHAGEPVPALSALHAEIPEGSTVAIVGPSGAGKTTLAALIIRLYDPLKGAVLLDGVDVRHLPLSWLRANIAVVMQEPFLLNATVLENLRYGNPSASLAEVEQAARRAQIHERIAALPNAYHTLVGERGYRFSAGERQRLAMARAIVKDAPILILDEATSALDSVGERRLQQSIAPWLSGRTSVIIAHRLSTIRGADQILVMDRGSIIERGTHEGLLTRGGRYAQMWFEQARRSSAPLVAASLRHDSTVVEDADLHQQRIAAV